jgi:xylulose-5-phosphate/fructose-6-phosphate phosphoketolase
VWSWASSDLDGDTDVVLACAGDVPTQETLAAVDVLHELVPDLKVRVVNVVDLGRLFSPEQHPHGISDREYGEIFTCDKPVIFAFHGYPWLIHRLTYRRPGHDNLHVWGFHDYGTTTTPFDMCVLNELDRFHLALAALERVPRLEGRIGHLRQELLGRLARHHDYIRRTGRPPRRRSFWWSAATATTGSTRRCWVRSAPIACTTRTARSSSSRTCTARTRRSRSSRTRRR